MRYPAFFGTLLDVDKIIKSTVLKLGIEFTEGLSQLVKLQVSVD